MKNSVSKKVSLFLTAFAVCLMTLCVSIPVKAAGPSPLQLTNAAAQSYPTTSYIYLESVQDLGATIPNTDLKYSLSDATVASGTPVSADRYNGKTSDGKFVYIVKSTFSPGATVYLKYQDYDVLTGVTAPSSVSSISQTGATENSVNITWTAVTGASGYIIYSGATAQDISEKGQTAGISYTISGLAKDGTYGVMVIPYKTNGKGQPIAWLSGNTIVKSVYTACGKVSGVKFEASIGKKKQYAISWTNNGGINNASGFEIQVLNSKGKVIAKSTETRNLYNIITSSKLRTQGWKVKVRAYSQLTNGVKFYGKWSDEKVVVPDAYIKKIKQTSKNSNNIKITWGKISGAKDYTVYRSTRKNGGYKKLATVKGTSYTTSQNANGQFYYYYVKANGVKIGKKKYSSNALKEPDWYGYKLTKRYYYY